MRSIHAVSQRIRGVSQRLEAPANIVDVSLHFTGPPLPNSEGTAPEARILPRPLGWRTARLVASCARGVTVLIRSRPVSERAKLWLCDARGAIGTTDIRVRLDLKTKPQR